MTESHGLHEDFHARAEVKSGSDRNFGLVFAGGLTVLAGLSYWRGHHDRALVLIVIAAIFMVGALLAPHLLRPFNRAWFKFGMLLSRIVSPAAMALIFYGAVTPVAALIRLRGGDPLRLRFEPAAKSYWIERDPPGPAPGTMTNQF